MKAENDVAGFGFVNLVRLCDSLLEIFVHVVFIVFLKVFFDFFGDF